MRKRKSTPKLLKSFYLCWRRIKIYASLKWVCVDSIWLLCNVCKQNTSQYWNELRHDKTNKMTVHPAKTQISLGIRPVWSESSLCAQWVAKDLSFLHADSKDSDQTGWMPRLIWVFPGSILILLVLSCRGSNLVLNHYRYWVHVLIGIH